eukprot:7434198-Pyramimonas_sp.AAC.1
METASTGCLDRGGDMRCRLHPPVEDGDAYRRQRNRDDQTCEKHTASPFALFSAPSQTKGCERRAWASPEATPSAAGKSYCATEEWRRGAPM